MNKLLVAIGCASVVALGGIAYVASPFWLITKSPPRSAPAIATPTKSRAADRPPLPSTEQRNGHDQQAHDQPVTDNLYDQPVTDPEEIAGVVKDFQSGFGEIKIPATVDSCRLVEQVAVGVVGGIVMHGAICRVSIAGAPERDMALCNDDGVGHFAIQFGSWVDDREWVADFVRNNCTGG